MDENIQEQELSAQQLSELLQIRRDKLDALREAGKDPFETNSYNVTAYSGDIKASFVDPPEGEAHYEQARNGKSLLCGSSG